MPSKIKHLIFIIALSVLSLAANSVEPIYTATAAGQCDGKPWGTFVSKGNTKEKACLGLPTFYFCQPCNNLYVWQADCSVTQVSGCNPGPNHGFAQLTLSCSDGSQPVNGVCSDVDPKSSGPVCDSTNKPIAIGSGNKWLVENDISSNIFSFSRTYNSNPQTELSTLGANWQGIQSKRLELYAVPEKVRVIAGDGKAYTFKLKIKRVSTN